MRRTVTALAAVLGVGVMALEAAGGDVRGADPARDVRAAGLTARERAALDIRSVRVIGEEGLGAFVLVKFGGNLEQAIGRGHLKGAVAGIVLHPKQGAGSPAGLLTEGAELVRQTVRVSPSKRVQVTVTQRDDYRKTRSKTVGVIRHGSELFFFILGPGFSNVASVEVKVFAKLWGSGTRSLAQLPPIPEPWWDPFQKGQPADDEELVVDLEDLSTDQLKELQPEVKKKADDLVKSLEPVELAIERLDRLIADLGETNPAVRHLEALRDGWKELHKQKLDEVRKLNGFRQVIEKLIEERTTPPPPPPPPQQPKVGVAGDCSFFDTTEVVCHGKVLMQSGGPFSPVDALQLVVPAAGSTPRRIVAFICPPQLPAGSLSQTAAPNDTLTCSGGTLPIGQAFAFNLRTDPVPAAGMGVNVLAREGGVFQGPFALSGP